MNIHTDDYSLFFAKRRIYIKASSNGNIDDLLSSIVYGVEFLVEKEKRRVKFKDIKPTKVKLTYTRFLGDNITAKDEDLLVYEKAETTEQSFLSSLYEELKLLKGCEISSDGFVVIDVTMR